MIRSILQTRHRPPYRQLYAATAAIILAASPLFARVDLTTLPAKSTSELTIYNSQDLTLARESRLLSFRKGMNEIQFSWANTQIDPTSLQIDLKNAKGLTLLDAVYPQGTNEVIVWNIEAEEATSAPIEITYFVRGLSWSGNYIVRANANEDAFDLQQFTRIANNSGEDYEKTHVRVVIGDVNLTEKIDALIERWKNRFGGDRREINGAVGGKLDAIYKEERDQKKPAMLFRYNAAFDLGAADKLERAKEILKTAVSEYRLFSVEGDEDIEGGWSKALPNPKIDAIPFDLSYELDTRRFGPSIVKFYKLHNDTKHKLGKDVLPEGSYYVYRDDGSDGVAFEGSTTHLYVPEGEKIELNLGNDGLVVMEDHELTRTRGAFAFNSDGNLIGWDETVTRRLDVKNSRERAVPFKLTHYLEQNSEVIASEPKHQQVDRETIRWEMSLPAQSTSPVTLTYATHFGTNVKAN